MSTGWSAKRFASISQRFRPPTPISSQNIIFNAVCFYFRTPKPWISKTTGAVALMFAPPRRSEIVDPREDHVYCLGMGMEPASIRMAMKPARFPKSPFRKNKLSARGSRISGATRCHEPGF